MQELLARFPKICIKKGKHAMIWWSVDLLAIPFVTFDSPECDFEFEIEHQCQWAQNFDLSEIKFQNNVQRKLEAQNLSVLTHVDTKFPFNQFKLWQLYWHQAADRMQRR